MQLRSDVNPKGIFVCGLPDSTESREVYEYFSKFGVVTEVNLINRMEKFNSRLWGFVNFRDTDTVEKVLEAQPHVINATRITVSHAISRTSGDTDVSHAKVATHWITGLSRGFGFVKFTDKAAFDNGVLEACHNINGSEIEVKPAMPESLSRFFGF
ncbi:unnamed protein product [Dibothriocephalus latus]|uniref:RRM domain-containing protein n=1 Tax=Dibothriocephalus latus TaxID=60516 RepID=A0A3P7LEA0_DIBLA|nr:unnamed protein product [Dibothriocephalus latus]